MKLGMDSEETESGRTMKRDIQQFKKSFHIVYASKVYKYLENQNHMLDSNIRHRALVFSIFLLTCKSFRFRAEITR